MMTAQKPADAPDTDGPLQPARAALSDAISALVDPRPHLTDQGLQWLDSRYHDLREALTSQRLGASHAAGPKEPAWLAAIEQLKIIDHAVRKWEPAWPVNDCDEYPTIQRLRQIDARKWRPQDTDRIDGITNDVQAFTAAIDKLLDPPKIIFLANPCPRCRKTETHRVADGELLRIAALQITYDDDDPIEANCNHCRAHWPELELKFLGLLLGNRIEGVIDHNETA